MLCHINWFLERHNIYQVIVKDFYGVTVRNYLIFNNQCLKFIVAYKKIFFYIIHSIFYP